MTTPSSSWQQAWDSAQPRLQTIRQSLPTLPYAAPRVLRVGQLDAELLDQELLQILTEPLGKAIGLIQVCRPVSMVSNELHLRSKVIISVTIRP
jgi:peroxin-2